MTSVAPICALSKHSAILFSTAPIAYTEKTSAHGPSLAPRHYAGSYTYVSHPQAINQHTMSAPTDSAGASEMLTAANQLAALMKKAFCIDPDDVTSERAKHSILTSMRKIYLYLAKENESAECDLVVPVAAEALQRRKDEVEDLDLEGMEHLATRTGISIFCLYVRKSADCGDQPPGSRLAICIRSLGSVDEINELDGDTLGYIDMGKSIDIDGDLLPDLASENPPLPPQWAS